MVHFEIASKCIFKKVEITSFQLHYIVLNIFFSLHPPSSDPGTKLRISFIVIPPPYLRILDTALDNASQPSTSSIYTFNKTFPTTLPLLPSPSRYIHLFTEATPPSKKRGDERKCSIMLGITQFNLTPPSGINLASECVIY